MDLDGYSIRRPRALTDNNVTRVFGGNASGLVKSATDQGKREWGWTGFLRGTVNYACGT